MLHVKKILALVLLLAACSSSQDVPVEETDAGISSPRTVMGNPGGSGGTTERFSDGGPLMMNDATDAAKKDAQNIMSDSSIPDSTKMNPDSADAKDSANRDGGIMSGLDSSPVSNLPATSEVIQLLNEIGVPPRVVMVMRNEYSLNQIVVSDMIFPMHQSCWLGALDTLNPPEKLGVLYYYYPNMYLKGSWETGGLHTLTALTVLTRDDIQKMKINVSGEDKHSKLGFRTLYDGTPTSSLGVPRAIEDWIEEKAAFLAGKTGNDLKVAMIALLPVIKCQ